VSLLSRNELRVVVCPDRLALQRAEVRLTRRGYVTQAQAREVVASAGDAETGDNWSAALRTLEEALPRFAAAGMQAQVVLSNHFIHYMLVPWMDNLSDAEELVFARHCFSEIYGAAADDWSVRVSLGRRGAPTLASAVPTKLLEDLRGAFEKVAVRVHSIQPHLMAACNSCDAGLEGRSAWIALLERNSLCLAMLHQGQLTWVRQLRIGDEWHAELPAILEREAYLADAAETDEVLLWAPHLDGAQVPPMGRWRIEHLIPAGGHFDAGLQGA
jgi:hypothetical protein